MTKLSRETIEREWGKLPWEEQHEIRARHVRVTHIAGAWYKAQAESHKDPMEFWRLMASSCAALIPPEWIAQLEASYVGLDMLEIA